jgi:hypothetical protein
MINAFLQTKGSILFEHTTYLVLAKVRERLAVNIQTSHRFHMDRFNKLNEVKGKEKYHAEVSNRFAALEDFDTEVRINSVWEMIERILKFQPKRL